MAEMGVSGPAAGSPEETLREGSKPKSEAVKEVVYNQSAIAKARAMYNDHTHGQNMSNEAEDLD